MRFLRISIGLLAFLLALTPAFGVFAQIDSTQTKAPPRQQNEGGLTSTTTAAETQVDDAEDESNAESTGEDDQQGDTSSAPPPIPTISSEPQEDEEEEQEQKRIVEERDSEENLPRTERDSDNDGLTDYDEEEIYGSDPNNPDTSGNGIQDGEMVERGIDPVVGTLIDFEDPREEADESFSEDFTLTEIQVERDDAAEADQPGERTGERVRFAGRAQPNSYVTLYIFSTPTIVTVRSDGEGEWEYTLDRELPDGEHEVYMATVNNSGRILARSDSIQFEKQGSDVQVQQSVSAAIASVDEVSLTKFMADNFVLVSLLIVLLVLILGILIVGVRKGSEEA